MARPSAARRPTELRPPAAVSQHLPASVIQFDPELAVQAIAFHLADEGISPQVDPQSVRATVVRLRRGVGGLSIEQQQWADMSNPQRLEWLMEKTQTVSRLVSDEVCVLEPARG